METWSEVVTHPLGLAGFALFLVFSILSKTRSNEKYPWLGGAFVAMAIIALLGGLALSYRQSGQGSEQAGKEPSTVIQHTDGNSSPALQGVDGDVNLTISDSPDQRKPGN